MCEVCPQWLSVDVGLPVCKHFHHDDRRPLLAVFEKDYEFEFQFIASCAWNYGILMRHRNVQIYRVLMDISILNTEDENDAFYTSTTRLVLTWSVLKTPGQTVPSRYILFAQWSCQNDRVPNWYPLLACWRLLQGTCRSCMHCIGAATCMQTRAVVIPWTVSCDHRRVASINSPRARHKVNMIWQAYYKEEIRHAHIHIQGRYDMHMCQMF